MARKIGAVEGLQVPGLYAKVRAKELKLALSPDPRLSLGDLGAKQGILGGINAVIVGNYLTTLGRPAEADLELLADLQMPIKALNASL